MLVYCRPCKTHKPTSEFRKNKRMANGYDTQCAPCRRAKAAAVMRKSTRRVTDVIRSAKDVPCADCGERYHYCVMDFDHRDAEDKLFTIARGKNNLPLVIAEIAKCDVVCANCHRIRTWNRKMASSKENAIS